MRAPLDGASWGLRRIGWIAAVVATLACDPGSFKRFSIDPVGSTTPIEVVLQEFEAEHIGDELVRAAISREVSDAYLDCECRVLGWYDRDAVVTLERGSFFYLAVFVDSRGQLAIAMAAFPSFGEPEPLEALRLALSRKLAERGFVVE